jgi:hypothetical protein
MPALADDQMRQASPESCGLGLQRIGQSASKVPAAELPEANPEELKSIVAEESLPPAAPPKSPQLPQLPED